MCLQTHTSQGFLFRYYLGTLLNEAGFDPPLAKPARRGEGLQVMLGRPREQVWGWPV